MIGGEIVDIDDMVVCIILLFYGLEKLSMIISFEVLGVGVDTNWGLFVVLGDFVFLAVVDVFFLFCYLVLGGFGEFYA